MKRLNNDGFLSFLGLLLTLMIIGFLSYTAFRNYYSSVSQPDKEMENSLKEQSINTTSYQSVLDSTRKRINDLNQQEINRAGQLGNLNLNQF